MLTKLFANRREGNWPAPSQRSLTDNAPFREFFATIAASVAVITFYAGKHLHGFTATTVTPVSLSPPLALFCVNRKNESHRHLKPGAWLGISMLAPDQAALSRRFADRVPLGGYGDVPIFESQPGVPILKGAMAGINAIVARLIPAGDHTIYLCGLGKCISRENPSPLLYCNRRYHELGAEVPAAS